MHVQLRQAMIYTVAHLAIQIQAMIYNAARIRSFSTKLQVDTCTCAVAHLVVEIQAMIYNVAMVKRLFTKFQVDACKTKKDTSAQLRTLQLRSKT